MDLSNLLNYYGIFSSLLVGIISVVGTYVVNKYNSKQNYKDSYKNMLIERKLRAIEALFKVMQNFTTVTDRDGWFSWMNHLEELDKILIDFKNIEKDLVWFPIQFRNQITLFDNHLRRYRRNILENNYGKDITAYKDQEADNFVIERSKIEEQLYAFLSDETDVIKVFKRNSDFLKHVEWKRDKYGNE